MTTVLDQRLPSTTSAARLRTAASELLECALVLALYGFLVLSAIRHGGGERAPATIMLLLSEGLVVVLFLVRRRADRQSTVLGDWLIALTATCLPLAMRPDPSVRAWVPIALGLLPLVGGFLIQLHAKLSLGRSMGAVPALRGVRTRGPYRFVRHPMYCGYLLSQIGFVLLNPSARNLIIVALAVGAQLIRVRCEERFLSQDPEYVAYASRVRSRLLPGIF